jgi:hypothetical protein
MNLYRSLQEQAQDERASDQVWHEADIEGHHLYMADTSFGDGPIFRFDQYMWGVIRAEPHTIYTSADHLERALEFAERAEWVSRFIHLDDTE